MIRNPLHNLLRKWSQPIGIILLFLIWVFLFRGYFSQTLTPINDSPGYYYKIKYHLDSLKAGFFPLWNPFDAWGRPDETAVLGFGLLNPFIYIIYIFQLFGFNFSTSYLLYLGLYYFLGSLGFLYLSAHLFNQARYRFLAAGAFLFSSIGPMLFTDHILILLIVPGIWFFYFLLDFLKNPCKRNFFGMTFCLMINLITYMPFYFLIVFLLFVACTLFFCRKQVLRFVKGVVSFFPSNKLFSLLCISLIILSSIPGLLWFLNAADPQTRLIFRQTGSGDAHKASMHIDIINQGGIGGQFSYPQMFSFLEYYSLDQTVLLYVSLFIFLALLLGLFNRSNRKLTLLFSMGLFLFLFSLTNAAPLHRFLFNHLFFVRYFRNIVYFLFFLIPLVILFSVEQLRLFLEDNIFIRHKRVALGVFCICALHAAVFIFLFYLDHIVLSSYITVGLSCLFFVLFLCRFFEKKTLWQNIFLLTLLLIQPLEVYTHFSRNSPKTVNPFENGYAPPRFSFQRPSLKEEDFLKAGRKWANVKKVFRDKSGMFRYTIFGTTWYYDLKDAIDHDVLFDYARWKIWIYDWISPVNNDRFALMNLEEAFRQKINTAFVHNATDSDMAHMNLQKTAAHPLIIKENTDLIQVTHFDPNSIEFLTNFPGNIFLVYNDCFHDQWRAYMDGQSIKILRTNGAFKGLYIPKGKHQLKLVFGHPVLYAFFYSYILVITFSLLGLFFLWQRQRNRHIPRT